jgi:hypothetical protein
MGITYWIIDDHYIRIVYTPEHQHDGVEVTFDTEDVSNISMEEALSQGVDQTVFFL